MTDKQRENLSMLIDGEADTAQCAATLQQLRGQPELRASWESYHLIGDALRSDLPDFLDRSLHQRIAAALEREPTVLAPRRRSLAEVVSHPWLRPLAGAAIAASVATVAVVSVPMVANGPSLTGSSMVAQNSPLSAPMPSNGIVTVAEGEHSAAAAPVQPDPAMTYYLFDHARYGGTGGVRIVAPYARTAGIHSDN